MTSPASPEPRGDADRRRSEPSDEPDPGLLLRVTVQALRPYAGWVFVGAGALLVLLGYLGVSREAEVAKQMPYLVSGGIGGVLLCIVGAYFLGTEELRKDGSRLDDIERQVAELHAALLERADAPRRPGPTERSRRGDGATSADATPIPTVIAGRLRGVVAVDGGEAYHRGDCALAAGKDVTRLSLSGAAERGLRPCPVCEPAVATRA